MATTATLLQTRPALTGSRVSPTRQLAAAGRRQLLTLLKSITIAPASYYADASAMGEQLASTPEEQRLDVALANHYRVMRGL